MEKLFDLVEECFESLAESGYDPHVRDALKTHAGRVRIFARQLVYAMGNTPVHHLVERRRQRYLNVTCQRVLRTDVLAGDAEVSHGMVNDYYRFCYGSFAKNPKPRYAPGQVERCMIHPSCTDASCTVDCPFKPQVNRGVRHANTRPGSVLWTW
jgi:hypothetical protein